MKTCDACGAANADNAAFCTQCGHAMAPSPQASAPATLVPDFEEHPQTGRALPYDSMSPPPEEDFFFEAAPPAPENTENAHLQGAELPPASAQDANPPPAQAPEAERTLFNPAAQAPAAEEMPAGPEPGREEDLFGNPANQMPAPREAPSTTPEPEGTFAAPPAQSAEPPASAAPDIFAQPLPENPPAEGYSPEEPAFEEPAFEEPAPEAPAQSSHIFDIFNPPEAPAAPPRPQEDILPVRHAEAPRPQLENILAGAVQGYDDTAPAPSETPSFPAEAAGRDASAPSHSPISGSAPPPASGRSVYTSSPQPSPPKHKKGKAPLLIAVAVLLVVALGIGAFFVLGGPDLLFSGGAQSNLPSQAGAGVTSQNTPNGGSALPSNAPSAAASLPAANPLDIAAALTTGEIDQYVEVFYISFLQCVNEKDIGLLRGATPAGKQEVEARLQTPGNQTYFFEYVSCGMVESTRKELLHEELPAVEFDVNFHYLYWPREGDSTKAEGSNTQTIQLVYTDGQWLVNQFVRHSA